MHPVKQYLENPQKMPLPFIAAALSKSEEEVEKLLTVDLLGLVELDKGYLPDTYMVDCAAIPVLQEFYRFESWGVPPSNIKTILRMLEFDAGVRQSQEMSKLKLLKHNRLLGYTEYEARFFNEEHVSSLIVQDSRPLRRWLDITFPAKDRFTCKDVDAIFDSSDCPRNLIKEARLALSVPLSGHWASEYFYTLLQVRALSLYAELSLSDKSYLVTKRDIALITEYLFMRHVRMHWHCKKQIRRKEYPSDCVEVAPKKSTVSTGSTLLESRGFSAREVATIAKTTFNQMKESGYVS